MGGLASSGLFNAGNIGSIAAVLAVLVAAASIIGVSFRNGRSAQVLANYKGLAESYALKHQEQEAEIKALQERLAQKDIQLSALQERVSTLQELVTGRATYDQLAADFGRLVTQNESRTAEILAQTGQVRSEVREMRIVLDEMKRGASQ